MLYGILFGGYILFIVLVAYLLKKRIFWCVIVVCILIAAPYWQQIWTKYLMSGFEKKHAPLQQITKTVEYPGSVLWIDNVWPGFDEKAREWMVETYLDGVHLQVLGLNDGKGNIYVYRATPEDFIESRKMKSSVDAAKTENDLAWEKAGGLATKEVVIYQSKYFDLDAPYRAKIRQEVIPIINNAEIYSYDQIVNEFTYKVVFQPIQLSARQKKYFWSDEIIIYEGKEEQTIAFSKRCMGYTPRIGPHPTGWPFHGGGRLGDPQAYAFDDKVLFDYAETYGGLDNIRNSLDR